MIEDGPTDGGPSQMTAYRLGRCFFSLNCCYRLVQGEERAPSALAPSAERHEREEVCGCMKCLRVNKRQFSIVLFAVRCSKFPSALWCAFNIITLGLTIT